MPREEIVLGDEKYTHQYDGGFVLMEIDPHGRVSRVTPAPDDSGAADDQAKQTAVRINGNTIVVPIQSAYLRG